MKWFQFKKRQSLMDALNDQYAINVKKFTAASKQYQDEHKDDLHSCKNCNSQGMIYCKHCEWNPKAHLDDNWEPRIPKEIYLIYDEKIDTIKKEFGVDIT